MPEAAANENINNWSENGVHPDFGKDQRCQFRVGAANPVRVNATLSDVGDWQWQFCSPSGEVLSESAGYRSEAECRAAVLRLQNEAAYATITSGR